VKATYNELENRILELEKLLDFHIAEKQNYADQLAQTREELRKTVQRANESEEIFRQFLLNCPIYVFFKDPEIRILHLSNNFSEMLGLPVEQLIGKTMDEVFPFDLAKTMIEDDLKTLREGKILEVEEELNGRFYYTQKFPIYLKNKPLYLAGYTMDITERKKSEQIIQQQNKELIELNKNKDHFISILAHDLKSPFNILLGFSELLTENIRTYDIKTTEDIIHLINDTLKNTYKLLENILLWTRSNSGKVNLEPRKIHFKTLCFEVVYELQNQANVKGIKINYNPKNNIKLFADYNSMKVVVRNLVSNAIKFTKAGGYINISGEVENNYAVISVTDSGVGIEKQNIHKLWDFKDSFKTLGTDNERGTGFGLIICKEFVEKNKGIIWAESKLGEGSIFKFTVPLFADNE